MASISGSSILCPMCLIWASLRRQNTTVRRFRRAPCHRFGRSAPDTRDSEDSGKTPAGYFPRCCNIPEPGKCRARRSRRFRRHLPVLGFHPKEGSPSWGKLGRWGALLYWQIPVTDIVGTVAGNLRRSVEIDIHSVWQNAFPIIQDLYGHDLAGKHDLVQILRDFIVQNLEIVQDIQSGNSPDDGGDFPLMSCVTPDFSA